MEFNKAALQREVIYKTSRSGGKGGQNVNKVSTKVELMFDVRSSLLFDEEQKELITAKLQNRLNRDGLVQVICEEERSQLLNKERAIDKLMSLLSGALHRPKVRKSTKVSRQAKARRLEQKRILSVKKQLRRGEL